MFCRDIRFNGERKDQGKFGTIIEAQERSLIIDALKKHRGNAAAAARELRTTQRILNYRIKMMGITPKKYRV